MAQETVVVIVGAGPAGIATSACLNRLSVPNVVLESENCCASLWKNRSYDRLKLHLAKQYCQLPNMPFPDDAPTFVPKSGFIRYLDNYVSRFKVKPLYGRSVRSAVHEGGRWQVEAVSGETAVEMFLGRFLVVATGENSERFVPKVVGLEGFGGGVLHSCEYVNGERFRDKDVLVVGSGNSGMEIAFDLSNYGVRTAISIRSPVHVLTKEIVQVGMYLLKWLPCSAVDSIAQSLSKLKYGDLSQYGIQTPTKGPFYLKRTTARSPVIDVGAIDKIKTGEIRVFPSLSHVKGDTIEFVNGKVVRFDAIVFATGYRTTVRKWLKDDGDLFNDNGMPKQRPPDHWKGNKGLYCVGFSSSGLFGISQDAENIAKDISSILNQSNN